MTLKVQITLIIATILFFILLQKLIKKSKMTADLASIWIIFCIALVIIAIFPFGLYFVSNLFGIISSTNLLFVLLIFILLCLVFYLYLKISSLEAKLTNLIQYIAIEKNKDEKIKKNKEFN
ncbi:DUF2304 domain-containing protein [Anaerorhabdus sp.]|uniref:DUF2304 domain-containing protein n=1 Tax=Anaerorhabdus sp. TaxID=1872524 RepID=UPI002FC5F7FD